MTLFTLFTCEDVRRRLEAYHDRELSVPEQITVGAHVDLCDECAAALRELRGLRSAMVAFSHQQGEHARERATALGAAVVGRLKAERDMSFLASLKAMFDDIRLVYAGLGAMVATVVCLVIMLGMMRFATNERPDSLAAIVTLVATPLQCESGSVFGDTSGCRARWEGRFHRAHESAEADSVFALDEVVEVVTNETGHLTNLQTLRGRRRAASGEAEIIEGLLDAVSRARLEGDPVAAISDTNMLSLVEHATVRGDKPGPLDPLPPVSLSPLGPRPLGMPGTSGASGAVQAPSRDNGSTPKKRAEHSTTARPVWS